MVSIDGKTVRRAFDRAASASAIPLGSAWAHRNRLVLGQGKVEDKSNEITALPKLLQRLDLRGATVTIDAMGGQQESAKAITEPGTEYGLALKKNHRHLYDAVTLFRDDAPAREFAQSDPDSQETVDGDHGRIETRKYWSTSAIAW
jgi:predicted transposase YbfD/YdcC